MSIRARCGSANSARALPLKHCRRRIALSHGQHANFILAFLQNAYLAAQLSGSKAMDGLQTASWPWVRWTVTIFIL
jgi:hypothetical protein